MAEVFEGSNLQRSAWLTVIKVIDHVSALSEVNKMQIKFVAHGIDVPDQIDSVLLSPLDVGGLVNQPRYHQVRTKLLAQLFGPNAGRMHEICPPMIMRLGLVFLPLVEGDATDQDNPLPLRRICRRDRNVLCQHDGK